MAASGATYRVHRDSGSILVDTSSETVVFTPPPPERSPEPPRT